LSPPQDIAPRYSGVLLGISNTAGVLAGVLGTAATGYMLEVGGAKSSLGDAESSLGDINISLGEREGLAGWH
jgi:hypothetical protein